ncbi:MAG: hypothetical protein D3907_01055 [Candidatus Electrothrix sp. AUS3]|nr:hypothetical protein [Candidatus Electrothrix gigas]
MNPLKKIPEFSNKAEERAFLEKHDSSDFVDWSTAAERVTLPNLKPSVQKISLRLPQSMLDDLKLLANTRLSSFFLLPFSFPL